LGSLSAHGKCEEAVFSVMSFSASLFLMQYLNLIFEQACYRPPGMQMDFCRFSLSGNDVLKEIIIIL